MPETSPLSVFFLGEDYLCFFWHKGNIIFVTFIHIYIKYHIHLHFFWERSSFIFRLKNKIMFSGKKIPSFQIIQKRMIFQWDFLGKIIFSEYLKKHRFFGLFWKRSSFVFPWKNRSYFRKKRNIIFSENIRKIIFQCYFCFEKTILSKYLEKENMPFRAVVL